MKKQNKENQLRTVGLFKQPIIRDRLTRRPTHFTGEQNTKQSVTIPGQEMTPQEILRTYAKERQKPFYSDLPIHEIRKLDQMDRADFLALQKQQQLQLQQQATSQLKTFRQRLEEKVLQDAKQAAPQSQDPNKPENKIPA